MFHTTSSIRSFTDPSKDAGRRFSIHRRRRSTPLLDNYSVVDGDKLLNMHLAASWVSDDTAFFDSFRYLAPTLLQLQHPSLPTIVGCGTLDGRLYMLTEPIEAVPLIRVLRAQPAGFELSLTTYVHVMRTMLEALSAIHGLRDRSRAPTHLIHNDIHAESVLISPDGKLHLEFDFPWIKTWVQRRRYRIIDTGLGTAVPPELLVAGPVDLRADLYSLAIQMTTLWGQAYREVDRHFTREARLAALNGIESALPELGTIFSNAMRPQPSDRYPNANAMLDSLNRHCPAAVEVATQELIDLVRTPAAQLLFETATESPSIPVSEIRVANLLPPSVITASPVGKPAEEPRFSTLNLPLSELPEISSFREKRKTPRVVPAIPTPAPEEDETQESLFEQAPPDAAFALFDPEAFANETTDVRAVLPKRVLANRAGDTLSVPTLSEPKPRRPHPDVSTLSEALRSLDAVDSAAPLRSAARSRIAGNAEKALIILKAAEITLPESCIVAHRIEKLMASVEAKNYSTAIELSRELDILKLSKRDRCLTNYYLGLAGVCCDAHEFARTRLAAIPHELAHRFPDAEELIRLCCERLRA